MNQPDLQRLRADLTRVRAIGRLVAPHRRQLSIGLALFLVARSAALLVPLVSAPIIDRFLPAGDRVALDRTIVVVVLLSLIALAASVTRDVIVGRTTNGMIIALRARIQKVLQTVPLQTVHRWRPGYWLSRVDGDVHSLAVLSGETTMSFIEDLISIVLASALLVYTSAKLSTILLVFAPLLVLSAIVLSRRMTPVAQ